MLPIFSMPGLGEKRVSVIPSYHFVLIHAASIVGSVLDEE